MSKRRILNITSLKKRDKMLTYSNSTSTSQSGSSVYAQAPAVLTGGSGVPAMFVWCATARDNVKQNPNPQPGTKFDTSTRTSSSCYMVGLKEKVEIQVADGLPWQWRRICFTFKGGPTAAGTLPIQTSSFSPDLETSVGYVRLMNQLAGTSRTSFYSLLFQGIQDTDWNDPLTAKLDNQRITVKYDKVTHITSGNEEGVIRQYSRWHPMGHNLEYDDDESGGGIATSKYSVTGKAGMGDYWVIDIFRPRTGSSASNLLAFNAESSLYWHEK